MRNKYIVIYDEYFNLYEVKETTKKETQIVYVSEDREEAMLCKEFLDRVEEYKEIN
ncbi:hypothetical protein [Clostridium paraputrificum]|uniref:hypothetical protein n=1 Tax=Clostridium paraputrificum TaxID=29363 RepID=UPI001B3C5928|nr:hypothetical protein [Clostridium paraputrificum]